MCDDYIPCIVYRKGPAAIVECMSHTACALDLGSVYDGGGDGGGDDEDDDDDMPHTA